MKRILVTAFIILAFGIPSWAQTASGAGEEQVDVQQMMTTLQQMQARCAVVMEQIAGQGMLLQEMMFLQKDMMKIQRQLMKEQTTDDEKALVMKEMSEMLERMDRNMSMMNQMMMRLRAMQSEGEPAGAAEGEEP